MSIVTIPDPNVPRLLTLDEDPVPPRKSLGNPAELVPPGQWIRDPDASCRTIHLADQQKRGVANSPADLSRLRGRVLLVIEIQGKPVALLLHPEIAAGWAQGLSVAVQGAMELPPMPPPAPPADAPPPAPVTPEELPWVDCDACHLRAPSLAAVVDGSCRREVCPLGKNGKPAS